jgi:CRISPR-associated protein Cmr4
MSFSTYRCLLMTIDPVHIGTGGMRLGRVDNSIVREPGTRLPKIPGTSLSGAIRSYAAYRYGKRTCAGKDGHCGRPTCPICYTFGSVKGEGSGESHSGVVSIGDARLLLFPVYSMAGPVWVTSPSALEDFGVGKQSVEDNKAKWGGAITSQKHLNLGWLMVEKDGGDWQAPDGLSNKNLPDLACNRIVLISDKLFSQVVNSNLEVRTSVAINPETGAAEDGALFTYEAIPRAAFLWMDVVVDDFRETFPSKKQLEGWKKTLEESEKLSYESLLSKWRLWKKGDGDTKSGDSVRKALEWIKDDLKHYEKSTMPTPNEGWKKNIQKDDQDDPQYLISAALEWAEHLGIGGMGTRGFGRIRALAECKVDQQTRILNCQPAKVSAKE